MLVLYCVQTVDILALAYTVFGGTMDICIVSWRTRDTMMCLSAWSIIAVETVLARWLSL